MVSQENTSFSESEKHSTLWIESDSDVIQSFRMVSVNMRFDTTQERWWKCEEGKSQLWMKGVV